MFTCSSLQRKRGKLRGDSQTKARKLRTFKGTGLFWDTAASRYKDERVCAFLSLQVWPIKEAIDIYIHVYSMWWNTHLLLQQGLKLREAQRKEKNLRAKLKKCQADLEMAQVLYCKIRDAIATDAHWICCDRLCFCLNYALVLSH